MLIKKNACECNKCGKIDIVELDVFAANVIIMSEQFYLCKDCITPVIDYITDKNSKIMTIQPEVVKIIESQAKANDELKKAGRLSLNEAFSNIGIDPVETGDAIGWPDNWNPDSEKAREYVMWSDYEIEKIVDMYRKGLTWKQIAKGLKLTIAQIYSLLAKIRNPKSVLNKEKYLRWAKQYPDVFIDTWKSKGGNNSNSPAIDKFSVQEIEEILEMHKNGTSWVNIADEKGVGRNTLWRLTTQLEQSKPGDRTYDLAVKYGYVVE